MHLLSALFCTKEPQLKLRWTCLQMRKQSKRGMKWIKITDIIKDVDECDEFHLLCKGGEH